MVEWRKKLAEARAEIGGDAATDIPAPGAGAAPRRVRLIITAQAPEPAAAGGVFKQIVRDFSDRSERGDPGALFGKYGGAFVPMAMGIPFTGAGGAMLVFLPPRAPHRLLPWVFGAIFTLAGLFLLRWASRLSGPRPPRDGGIGKRSRGGGITGGTPGGRGPTPRAGLCPGSWAESSFCS